MSFIILPDSLFEPKPDLSGVARPRAVMLAKRRDELVKYLAQSATLKEAVIESFPALGAYLVDPLTLTIPRLDLISQDLGVPIGISREVLPVFEIEFSRPAPITDQWKLEPGWHLERDGFGKPAVNPGISKPGVGTPGIGKPGLGGGGFLNKLKGFFGGGGSKAGSPPAAESTPPPPPPKPRPTGKGVVIGVIDVGLSKHAHVWDRVVSRAKVTASSVTAKAHFEDDANGHGTHVCGLLVGPHGLAPGASLACATVALAQDDRGDLMTILRAMNWLMTTVHVPNGDIGCDIINMSVSLNSGDERSYPIVKRMLKDHGTLLVTSAGNDEGPVMLFGMYDACLAVGATGSKDEPVTSSKGGGHPAGTVKPDIYAPGASILSCMPGDDNHVTRSGTSYATPQVAAAAALLLEKEPSLRRDGTAFRAAVLRLSRPTADGRVLDVSSLL